MPDSPPLKRAKHDTEDNVSGEQLKAASATEQSPTEQLKVVTDAGFQILELGKKMDEERVYTVGWEWKARRRKVRICDDKYKYSFVIATTDFLPP